MKKEKYLTKLSQLKHGMRVKCTIIGEKIDDAKISIENGYVCICQNVTDGFKIDNKLGYKYSWLIGNLENKEIKGLCISKIIQL